ncbi:MAG: hypothetical protein MR559_03065 [Prevotella sp.]|nr:hypothetical protein [Prevotella sp.]
MVQIQPQVFTAKRSERQVVASNDKDGGSRVARLTSLRTEIWYKAKWEWTRLQDKSKSEWKTYLPKTVNQEVVESEG